MIVVTDLVAVSIAVGVAQWLRFSSLNEPLATTVPVVGRVSYLLISVLFASAWMTALMLADSRSVPILGSGPLEYKRVLSASFGLFGMIAITSYLLRLELARGYLLASLPLGVTLLLLSRWLCRQWLVRQRLRGRQTAQVLLVGSEPSVIQIARELDRAPTAGYRVVGACLPEAVAAMPRTISAAPATGSALRSGGVPVVGTVNDLGSALDATQADTVVIASTDELPPDKVKQISWSLEASGQNLILAPSIADVAGPRIVTRMVAGLPLIHVELPRLKTYQLAVKRAQDLIIAITGIVLAGPLLLVIGVLVRASSPGPVLFRQTRVGHGGEPFTMYKFRTMTVDAPQRLATLTTAPRDAGNEVMFKLRNDPRVTSVGRVLRRFSLDELPQLINVISGKMSLVGPRPPLLSEVEQYADHVHRRFMVKPGITGLWQVSGRSTLSWDETVRLDLSYVENYSMVHDLLIIAKTVRAVLRPGDTAY